MLLKMNISCVLQTVYESPRAMTQGGDRISSCTPRHSLVGGGFRKTACRQSTIDLWRMDKDR